nr:orotate phosphoribosyltransferase [Saprospiraceae bacterium]
MQTVSRRVAHLLLKAKAVQLNTARPFTWASGIRSPIYCDNRKILSFVKIRNQIKSFLAEKSREFGKAELIAGVATAGIPHGTLLADSLELPFVYVRSKAKAHGLQSKIEGTFEEGMKTLVVEDLISTGKSSLEAVQSLRSEGLEVMGVAAIFTYQLEVAEQNFKQAKCPYFTLSDYSTLVDVALEEEYITADEVALLRLWREQPENWNP